MDIYQKILGIHIKQLKNLQVNHNKLFICFSAIPASGKTYVSKILEDRYKAVRVNNDDIREIITSIIPGASKEIRDKRQDVLQSYLVWFLENYQYPNKLIIIDSGIERKFDIIKKIAVDLGFDIFIIALNVSKDTAYKRSLTRNNGRQDDNFNQNIDRWIKENREFNIKNKSNISLNGENLRFESLFSKLDKLIANV